MLVTRKNMQQHVKKCKQHVKLTRAVSAKINM